MNIGISGASGQLGQSVLKQLAERGGGHQLIGISRSPQKITGAAVGRFGDYDQPETLVKAYAGIERLLIIPSAELQPGVRGRQLRAAINAAVHAGVNHVVLMSAAGTRQATEPALGEAYWTGEQHLIRTASDWTILRMNYYAEAMAQEIQMSAAGGVLAGLGEERVAYVSRDDVAAAAAGILLSEGHGGHAGAIYNATGPEIVSGPACAQFATKLLGTPIHFAVVPADQLRAGLSQAGLPSVVVETILDIKGTFVRGDFDVLTTDVERLSGCKPKSLTEVLSAKLSSQAALLGDN